MNDSKNNYNLEERTAKFGEEIVKFCRKTKDDRISNPIVNQLIRSGTSIGANYCEANGASSKKDFKNKIHICKKEAEETKYWLRIISTANSDHKDSARKLWQEAQELTLIFGKIVSKLRN